MIRDVYLHGRLGTKFGKVHALDVESPAEAFQALAHQLPGFREYVSHRKYCVSVGKGSVLNAEQLDLRLGRGRDIHLTPAGLVSGIETIILGGILLFTAVTAVAVLSMPQVPPPGSREEATKTNSFIFDGPTQSTEQGHPPALIYGRVRVGSVVGSSGIATTDVTEAGVSANPANPGGGGGGGGYSGYVGSTPGIRDSPYGNEWQYQLAKGGKGGGGGQTRSAQEDPNSLQSQATAKILDIIGEGEIVGLVDGLKSVYFDNTPLQNADGTFNFAGVAVEQRTGLPDQDFIPGFTQTENTVAVDQRVSVAAGPVTKTITDSSVSVARVTVRLPQLYRQDTTNGDLKFASVSVKISVQTDGGGFTDVTTMDFNGKTTSGYQRSVDVRLPNGNQRDVRITRITPDSEVSSLVNETRWDLLTEIVEAKLSYPDTALIGLTVDARQFGSNVPNRGFEVKGLIIDVPSNYNPETRVYTGMWDGTFKRAWTDNPAWVFRDLIVNRRYGLGTRIDPASVNKWSLYAIAQYNDELIPDGMGGMQPRYTINCCINTRADAREVLASIASNFRGWAYLTSGSIMAAQDRPEDPSILVTPSNTVDGVTYGRITSAERRRSVAVVYWNDPDDNYKLTPEVYEVPDLVRRFGRRTGDEVTAFGVTNRGQAHRMARWIMEDEAQGSNSIATYDVGDDHAFVEPGRIAAIADPMFTTSRRGGRVVSASANQVKLDAPVTLTPGQTYTLRVVQPDGIVRVRAVLNAAGQTDTLDLGGNAYALVPRSGAVWTVESTTVANRQFRVRAIQQDEPPYRVRAVLHDPTKYERVELDRDISTPNFMELPQGPLERPSGLDIAEFLLPDGTASVPAVQFSWNSPVDPRISLYQVQFQRPGGANWEPLDDGINVSRSIRGATPGTWSFRVRGLDALGNKTAWIVYSETLGAQQTGLPNVSQLSLAVSDEALAAALVWTAPADTRPLRAEVLFSLGDVLANAESLGVIDGQEFPVSQPGRYWVRSAFMEARSANPPSVLVEASDLPQVGWDSIDGKPETLADLDPGGVLALNNTLQALADADAQIEQTVSNLDASVSTSLSNLNTALGQLDTQVDQIALDIDDPTTGLKVRVGSVETANANLATRVSAVEVSINAAGTGLKARTSSLETATANLQTGKADASRVTALETSVNASGTGLLARTSSLETATSNLQTGKADASRVTALETAVNQSGTGILARLTASETATANLQTGKADASRVTALETSVNAAGTGLLARTSSLETATANLQTGKADASRVTALEASVNGGTGLLARTASLETATANLQTGKADASRVAIVEATASNAANSASLNKNSTFATWPAGQSLPDNIGGFGSVTIGKAAGKVSANSIQIEVASGVSNAGVEVAWQAANWNGRLPTANGQTAYWVIDYKIEVGTPNLGTSSLRFLLTDAATGATASPIVQPLLSSLHTSTGDDQIVESSYFFACSPNVNYSAYSARLAFFARGAAVSNYGRYYVHRLSVRPATAAEIAAHVALPAVSARVAITETAIVDLNGKTQARWALGTAVPGASAFMFAQAETSPGATPTSDVGIGARTISLYSQQGAEWKLAMQVVSGNVLFTGGLQAGAYIRLGTGAGWPVALKAVEFQATDGEAVSFGTNLGTLPRLSFAMNNLAPLSSGETYNLYADNLTATGFTMRAKINVPATPSNQSLAAPGTATTLGGKNGRQQLLGSTPVSASGDYSINVTGSTSYLVPRQTQVTDYNGNGSVEIWVRKSGTWSLAAYLTYDWSKLSGNSGGSDTYDNAPWVAQGTLQLGSGVEGIAAVVTASEGLQRTATVSGLGPITWQSQGSGSSIRSATPSGQKTKITVTPQ